MNKDFGDGKVGATSTDVELPAEISNLPQEKKGTDDDQRNMLRMGKSQQMKRNFRFVTIFGFSMILMASWEGRTTYVVSKRHTDEKQWPLVPRSSHYSTAGLQASSTCILLRGLASFS